MTKEIEKANWIFNEFLACILNVKNQQGLFKERKSKLIHFLPLAPAFLAGAFLAAFLAGAFLAAFFTVLGAFLAGAAFLGAAFLAGAVRAKVKYKVRHLINQRHALVFWRPAHNTRTFNHGKLSKLVDHNSSLLERAPLYPNA